eukprot:5456432-Amphidinium_carterae.4
MSPPSIKIRNHDVRLLASADSGQRQLTGINSPYALQSRQLMGRLAVGSFGFGTAQTCAPRQHAGTCAVRRTWLNKGRSASESSSLTADSTDPCTTSADAFWK